MTTSRLWGACPAAACFTACFTIMVALPLGCGGDDDGGGTPDAATATPDAAPTSDAAVPLAWETLVEKDWTLQPGSEDFQCLRIVLTEDVYVGAIRPIAPLGTHHTVAFVGDDTGVACAGNADSMMYAAGVGTGELLFPAGVGLKLLAGQSIDLQLHLFNPADEGLSGTSGIEIVKIAPASVTHEAEIFLPGPVTLDIPTGEQTIAGTCTVGGPQTLFAVFPHMHQLGTHLKATATVGGTTTTITDGPYDFYDQKFSPITPLALGAGDTITTECTWNNTTGATVMWGNSSTEEMCFTILYRYPRQGPAAAFCVN